MLHVETHQIRI